MWRYASIPNVLVFRPPATPPNKNDLISAMRSHRLICSEIRRIEVEEFELGPLPDDGILVENEFTAVSIGTEIYNLSGGTPIIGVDLDEFRIETAVHPGCDMANNPKNVLGVLFRWNRN